MDLWIRSQDKEKLLKANDIAIGMNMVYCYFDKNTEYELLGTYKSKERALEVLDELQNTILGIIANEDVEKQKIKKYTGNAILSKVSNNIVYEMPQK